MYLPESVVDRITLPMGWQSIAGESNDATRRKVLNIRQHLVEASLVRKSLRWLNAAVENTSSVFTHTQKQHLDLIPGFEQHNLLFY